MKKLFIKLIITQAVLVYISSIDCFEPVIDVKFTWMTDKSSDHAFEFNWNETDKLISKEIQFSSPTTFIIHGFMEQRGLEHYNKMIEFVQSFTVARTSMKFENGFFVKFQGYV